MTCIKTSMMTCWITTPPIINDLQSEIYFIILLLIINLGETRHVQLYLWLDFHCKAMQEILSSSNKYLVLWNIPNALKTCTVHCNSTYPQLHPTKSMMACMFRRVRLVPGLISSRNQIYLFEYFLYIYIILLEIFASCNHSFYLQETLDETIRIMNDTSRKWYSFDFE
jgi:hypothetical protein